MEFKMFNKLRTYSLILIIALLTGTTHAQWSQQNGPRGRASILYADSDIVFSFIDSSRIYKTTPASDNWVEAHTGIPGDFYIQNLIKAENMFLVTASSSTILGSESTVFISTDQGGSWTKSSLSLQYSINYITYIDSTIFVASNTSSGSPLHYSADQGVTWQECNGMVANGLTSMVKSGTSIYASTNLGVFVSVDKGVNWTKKNSAGIPAYSSFTIMVRDFNSTDEKIYGLLNSYPSIMTYSSIDSGNTWQADTTSGLPGGGGQFFYSNPVLSQENIYIIATADASNSRPTIYTTADYGSSWSQVGVPPFYPAMNLFIGGGSIYVGTSSGILKSTDFGATWMEFSNGIIYNGNTRGFASANGTLFTTFNGGVHSISAYPSEWSPVTVPDSAMYYSGILSQNNVLYLFTYFELYKSEDAGNTWTNILTGFPTNFYPTNFEVGNSKIYLSGQLDSDQVLYYSSDGGTTWNSNIVPVAYIASFKIIGSTIYLQYDKLYKSTDDGATWTELGTTGLDNPSRIGAFTESNGTVLVFIWDIDNPQILYSEDGNSWSAATGLGDGNSVNSFLADGNFVFAATKKGLFMSVNNGKTWISKSVGIGEKSVNEIYNQGKYYVASVWERAVWYAPVPNITDVESINSEIPEMFILEQNYPNPFNPSTTFSFSITKKEFVTLAIYNSIGEKVANIVSQNMHAGSYNFNWNANNLTSGVYFARLTAGSKAQVQKIMLLK
jgi:photosystem II stability/assembly factor-like uncharacterized protein